MNERGATLLLHCESLPGRGAPAPLSSCSEATCQGGHMYNTILVPLDGSKRAERILPHVEALARQFGARVVLLQVVEPVVGELSPTHVISYYDKTLVEQWLREAKHYLAGVKGELCAKGI